MHEFLKALQAQRSQQEELLKQLETGKFGVFERDNPGMRKLKTEQVTGLKDMIASTTHSIERIEKVIMQLNNAGHL